MGWLGRKPRKVGFGLTEAKPPPPRPPKYQMPKPAKASRNKAWGNAGAEVKEQPAASDVSEVRKAGPWSDPAASGSDAAVQAQQQIAALKKRSPWLGSLAEKMANAQAKGRAGPGQAQVPVSLKPKKSVVWILVLILGLMFFSGPFISGILMFLNGL